MIRCVLLSVESNLVPVPGGFRGVTSGKLYPRSANVYQEQARRMRWNRVAARAHLGGFRCVAEYLEACEWGILHPDATEDEKLETKEARVAVAWARSGALDAVPRLETHDPREGAIRHDDGSAARATRLPVLSVDSDFLRAYG